ncbi:MAG: hypothetical protein ALECFALPRED_004115 [Alectoria fallacina]|uniref:Uncharacterized protein n=1 Tax=Alectoria fallacina TaxID=1903189 RepID=A0A8H3FST9_9LECA|nr:MAG: hypothetical protein ALECFALPRED_004115 [Alectoria fallacina]
MFLRFEDSTSLRILIGAVQFAKQRFQGAMPGPEQQFLEQSGVEPGVTALGKHDQDWEAVKAQDRDFWNDPQRHVAHDTWKQHLAEVIWPEKLAPILEDTKLDKLAVKVWSRKCAAGCCYMDMKACA